MWQSHSQPMKNQTTNFKTIYIKNNLSSSSIIHKKLLVGQKIIKLLHKNINGFRLSNDYRAENESICEQSTSNAQLTQVIHKNNNGITSQTLSNPTVMCIETNKKDLSLTYGEIVPSSFSKILSLIQSLSGSTLSSISLEFVDLGCGTGELIVKIKLFNVQKYLMIHALIAYSNSYNYSCTLNHI